MKRTLTNFKNFFTSRSIGRECLKFLMNSFKLFPFAKKLPFFTHFLSFSSSIALLCNSKNTSNGQKMSNFRLNAESLNEFNVRT